MDNKKNGKGSNRLIGWLVSYALDKKGKSFEIRNGRSLISSEGEQSDKFILLTDNSIAAPHAALSANPRHRVLIQDIFSESGTYISRGDSKDERKVTSPTELQHGDWLRIGNSTRLQVCLIDGPSR